MPIVIRCLLPSDAYYHQMPVTIRCLLPSDAYCPQMPIVIRCLLPWDAYCPQVPLTIRCEVAYGLYIYATLYLMVIEKSALSFTIFEIFTIEICLTLDLTFICLTLDLTFICLTLELTFRIARGNYANLKATFDFICTNKCQVCLSVTVYDIL